MLLRTILAIALAAGSLSGHAQTRYIGALTVSSSSTRATAFNGCPPGYERASDQDLNEGAGGDFVFLCARYDGLEQAITDVRVHDGAEATCPAGLSADKHDLNKGARGRSLFLCFGRRPNGTPIVDLTTRTFDHAPVAPPDVFCSGARPSSPVTSDADNLPADVNRGAGGKYIYLCVQRANSNNRKP